MTTYWQRVSSIGVPRMITLSSAGGIDVVGAFAATGLFDHHGYEHGATSSFFLRRRRESMARSSSTSPGRRLFLDPGVVDQPRHGLLQADFLSDRPDASFPGEPLLERRELDCRPAPRSP